MSNLFTAVSVEQQETVAGGVVVVPDTSAREILTFNYNGTGFRSTSSAGINGPVTDTIYTNLSVNSAVDKSVFQTYFGY
ncbi:hypothetical protein BMF77_03166 [Dolichospermum sp. UHCC 0315A]|uniref:CTB family bacteriocin n=1 Tax=Dolichospermum sp. UHCC 0315A TaxID=1914871 RepID=UPI0011E6DF85|nr:CTB family bacteriocin [Dolichospermum sp. UHCC 0315A]QEI42556.1 hypothetical protein BMF77_03166 [Dolichospermum sp. UHCC 0315A]